MNKDVGRLGYKKCQVPRHEELFWGKDYEDMNDWVE